MGRRSATKKAVDHSGKTLKLFCPLTLISIPLESTVDSRSSIHLSFGKGSSGMDETAQ
jgi:hypothetical protein